MTVGSEIAGAAHASGRLGPLPPGGKAPAIEDSKRWI